MTFQSVLKEFGFKKRNVLHDDGHKSSYWYIQKKNWYAEIHVCTCYTEVWLVGKGLKESNGYPRWLFLRRTRTTKRRTNFKITIMKRTELEIFIQKHLIEYGSTESEFGMILANIPEGGSCNLTYVIADVIRAYNKSLVESLGEPSNDNGYELEPDENGKWWLTHKHVGSGEPFEQFLNSEPINR